MSKRLRYCIDVVLGAEGGYVDHEKDRGGKTNYGVTQKTYDVHRKRKGLPTQSVKFITEDEVDEIYLEYWDGAKCDLLPPELDLMVFDCSINSGPSRAIKLLQQVLGVAVDGAFGKMSHHALTSKLTSTTPKELCLQYLQVRRIFYRAIVDNDPSQEVFLKGWYNRLAKLEKLLDD